MQKRTKVELSELLQVAVIAGIFMIGMAIIVSLPVMYLWNWIVPDLTKGAVTGLTFWKALGLSILCNSLFKNYTRQKTS